MTKEELKDRWIKILRAKASDYEHAARKLNLTVSNPDIDDICNEMEAFFAGLRDQPTPRWLLLHPIR
jgi:hypothetical protein